MSFELTRRKFLQGILASTITPMAVLARSHEPRKSDQPIPQNTVKVLEERHKEKMNLQDYLVEWDVRESIIFEHKPIVGVADGPFEFMGMKTIEGNAKYRLYKEQQEEFAQLISQIATQKQCTFVFVRDSLVCEVDAVIISIGYISQIEVPSIISVDFKGIGDIRWSMRES